MTLSLATISLTQNLQLFEAQIAEAPKLEAAIHAAKGDPERSFHARRTADRHLTAMAITTGQIRTLVIGVDDLGPTLDSLSELGLRGIRLVALSELATLRQLWRVRHSFGLPRAIIDRLDALLVVDARLRQELDRITREWCQFRGTPNPDRATYRAAIRGASHATRALAEAPEVVAFLAAGCSCDDWPVFRDACVRLRTVLNVRIDVEPDSVLREHVHVVGGSSTRARS